MYLAYKNDALVILINSNNKTSTNNKFLVPFKDSVQTLS